jgi:hypothetical protein
MRNIIKSGIFINGELLELDYSTVSVGRKKLRGKMLSNASLQDLILRIEDNLLIIKI